MIRILLKTIMAYVLVIGSAVFADEPVFPISALNYCSKQVWADCVLKRDAQKKEKSNHLYAAMVADHIDTLSKQEEHCFYRRNILGDAAKCEELTIARLRQRAAYAHHAAHSTVQSDKTTYKEIGIPSFIEQVPTELTEGKASLTATLCSPTTDFADIQKNQQKQQFFESNAFIKDAVHKVLHDANAGEKALLDLWNKEKVDGINSTMSLYRLSRLGLRNSAFAGNLASASSLGTIMRMGILMIPPLDKNKLHWTLEYCPAIISGAQETIPFHCAIHAFEKAVKSRAEFNGSNDDISLAINIGLLIAYTSVMAKSEDPSYKQILGATLCIESSSHFYNWYKRRESAQEVEAHQSLIDVANYIRAAKKIYNLMQHRPELQELFPQFCPAYESVYKGESTKGIVRDLLKTDTFTGSPSAFSNAGRIALVAERIARAKEDLAPLMAAMGEIDASIALVHFKQQDTNGLSFIYTQPSNSTKSCIVTQDCMHPARAESIPNTLTLGADKPLTTMVTGPNGNGKSFFTKTLAASLVLSKTLGFVRAHTFEHTPFDEIFYVPKSSDDFEGKRSCFEVESDTMVEMVERNSRQACASKRGFYAVDEPASGTNATAGKECVELYAQEIDAISDNNNINVIITHHDIDAEKVGDVQFVQVGANGRKFIVTPGISKESNALALFKCKLKAADLNLSTTFPRAQPTYPAAAE